MVSAGPGPSRRQRRGLQRAGRDLVGWGQVWTARCPGEGFASSRGEGLRGAWEAGRCGWTLAHPGALQGNVGACP